MSTAILTDLTRCIGCEACVWACKEVNNLPRADHERLSATTWTALDHIKGVHVRRQCMHCEQPACVSVCPVGALIKTAAGPVIYKADRCIGCRYCMVGCPFSVPRYEWGENAPLMQKCIMCSSLLDKGGQPACTAACPTGATISGDRSELLALAHRRIREEPGRYVDHVYGEVEAGGTSVFYLSAIAFEELGFATEVRTEPYPELTWKILSKLPLVVGTAGIGLAGTFWIIRRRQKLAAERAEAAARRSETCETSCDD
jgi:formate dehydrogenase iron-sulfur subunit